MKKFKSKLKNQGGFTLIEMLIVVAIIAILVAVSIPLVNSSLERAREATDAANERAAKAAAVVKYLTEGADTGASYYYDAESGKIETGTPTTAPKYGKCTTHKDGYITVNITDAGVCTIKWNVNGAEVSTVHGIEIDN